MRACLVSSGTGGHLWPALVLSDALRAAGHETLLLTEGRVVERELLDRVGSRADVLPTAGRGVRAFTGLARGIVGARRILRERQVDFVISTGGRTSFAVGLAARSLRLPLFLLEQNAVLGRANRFLGRLARRVWLGLPARAPVRRALFTGTPLRKEFRSVDRDDARSALGLRHDVATVLVTGGSQGAGVLNELVPLALRRLGRGIQVLHLAGSGHDEEVRQRYTEAAEHGVRAIVRALAVDMASLYAAADLVVCRGGGGTVAELIAVGRPAVIVPYPFHKDRQQLHNGNVLARVGAAVIVEQRELSLERIERLLGDLLDARQKLCAMGEAARRLAPPDPCSTILADLERLVLRN